MKRLLQRLATAYTRVSDRAGDDAFEGDPCTCHDDPGHGLCPIHDEGWRRA